MLDSLTLRVQVPTHNDRQNRSRCFDELCDLLEKARFQEEEDTLIFAGKERACASLRRLGGREALGKKR